jgi:4-carboxymuconolactone decarboxylase
LLLFGVVAALGANDVLPIQLDAVLSNEEFTPDELREIALFLTHYVGWPRGSTFNNHVEGRIANHRKAREQGAGSTQRFPGPGSDE